MKSETKQDKVSDEIIDKLKTVRKTHWMLEEDVEVLKKHIEKKKDLTITEIKMALNPKLMVTPRVVDQQTEERTGKWRTTFLLGAGGDVGERGWEQWKSCPSKEEVPVGTKASLTIFAKQTLTLATFLFGNLLQERGCG